MFACRPEWPWCMKRKRVAPPFFATDEVRWRLCRLKLGSVLCECKSRRALSTGCRCWGILLAAVMGLQHSLAMVGGLITPPLVVSAAANDVGVTQVITTAPAPCL
jgi:hypothetical protein